MKESGATVNNEINAAYKSAEEAAINAGMDEAAAKKEAEAAAEAVAEKEGMSPAEAGKSHTQSFAFRSLHRETLEPLTSVRERERASNMSLHALDNHWPTLNQAQRPGSQPHQF